MKLVILSTDTRHHAYFIRKISEIPGVDISSIVYERRALQKPYPTGPFYNQEQDDFEEANFNPSKLTENLEKKVVSVHSVNQEGMREYLAGLQPDVGITFGTGIVKPYIFTIPKQGTMNVHRGLTQYHRGLDSDLWAILNGEFDRLGVTIHRVDETLDTGDVLGQKGFKITPDMQIYCIRYWTTLIATELVTDILKNNRFQGQPNPSNVPYFSAMPLDDKFVAEKRFNDYIKNLRTSKSLTREQGVI